MSVVSAPHPTQPTAESFAKSAPTRELVLIAEDNATTRNGLCELLRRRGYDAVGVDNGSAAIDALKSYQVVGLVLDLHMPGSDGFKTLQYVQEHRRSLPTVLLTGMEPGEIQAKMSRSHVDALPPLFQKPADIEQLLSVLEMLIEDSGGMGDEH